MTWDVMILVTDGVKMAVKSEMEMWRFVVMMRRWNSGRIRVMEVVWWEKMMWKV